MYEGHRFEYRPFYDKSFVILKSSFTKDDSSKDPKIEVRDSAAFAIFRIVKLGYGSLEEVKKYTAKEVLQILKFENFIADYERVLTDRIRNDYRG